MFRFKCTSCGDWHEGMPKLPLALEQRNGMTVDRVAEIYGYYERPASEERD